MPIHRDVGCAPSPQQQRRRAQSGAARRDVASTFTPVGD